MLDSVTLLRYGLGMLHSCERGGALRQAATTEAPIALKALFSSDG